MALTLIDFNLICLFKTINTKILDTFFYLIYRMSEKYFRMAEYLGKYAFLRKLF